LDGEWGISRLSVQRGWGLPLAEGCDSASGGAVSAKAHLAAVDVRAEGLADELDGVKLSVRADVADEVAVANTAEATLFLTSKTYSSKSTGKIMNVDGGVKDPYAR
jgi:hypothetical protein